MFPSPNSEFYAICSDLKRTAPDPTVDEETMNQFGKSCSTLPLFEKMSFDYIYTKHYSLERNEFLKCRWSQYKKNFEKRVFGPFQFPGHRDLHFYNGSIQFVPSQSTFRYSDHQMKLKPGPGVDFRGQMPIPQEFLMKRSQAIEVDTKAAKKKNTAKLKNKTGK